MNGFSGNTINQVIGPIGKGHVHLNGASVVFLSLGQNDLSQGFGDPLLGKRVAMRLKIHLCDLSSRHPNLIIVLLPILQRSLNKQPFTPYPESKSEAYIASINASIVELYNCLIPCMCHSSKLVIVNPFSDEDIHVPDGLHLSKQGKEKILLSAVGAFKQWINQQNH